MIKYNYNNDTTGTSLIYSLLLLNAKPKSNGRLMDRYEIKILFGVIMGALCIITTVGNIFVIFKYRKASMVGNLFIISLAVADLIVGSFVMPLATIYAITEVWTMTLPVCQIWLSADYTASTASILNLFTLSLDRYWSITSPLAYLGKRTKSRALIMISIAWSISLLWLAPITGWPYLFNKGVRYVPGDKCNTEYDKNIVFKVATAICNFYLPLIAMIAINTKIYLVIHKRYRNPIMRYSSICPNQSNNIQNGKKYSNPNASELIKSSKLQTHNNIPNTNSKNSLTRPLAFNYSSNLDLNKSRHRNEPVNKLKSFSSVEFFHPTSEHKQNSKKFKLINFAFLTSSSSSNLNSYSTPNLKFIKNDLTATHSPSSFLNCNKINHNNNNNSNKKAQELDHHRSVISKAQANRRIPSDSVKMSKLVYRDTKYIPNEPDRISPLFFRGSSDSSLKHQESNFKTESRSQETKEQNEKLNKKPKRVSMDKIQLSISDAKINRKGFMNKQEKAFKQLSAIVIGFTLCFLPYFIVFLIVAICEDCISDEVFTVTVWLGYFNSTMNPFLYALSNKRLNKKKIKHKGSSGDNQNNNNNNNQNNNNQNTTVQSQSGSARNYLLNNNRKSVW